MFNFSELLHALNPAQAADIGGECTYPRLGSQSRPRLSGCVLFSVCEDGSVQMNEGWSVGNGWNHPEKENTEWEDQAQEEPWGTLTFKRPREEEEPAKDTKKEQPERESNWWPWPC